MTLLRRGRQAQRDGDYVSAVSDFEGAIETCPGEEEPVDSAFTALRQLVVSRSLIDRFLADFGWSQEEYRGFDHLEPQLSKDEVRRRLDAVVGSVLDDSPLGSQMSVSLDKERLCESDLDAAVNGTDGHPRRPSDQMLFLSGLSALRHGEIDAAAALLSSTLVANPMCGSAYATLGRIYHRRRKGRLALTHLNLALSHLEDHWLGAVSWTVRPRVLGKYRNHLIVVHKSEFFAVPDSGEFFFSVVDGGAELYEHRIAPRVRVRLQRALPRAAVVVLRRVLYATRLRRELLRPVRMMQFVHDTDLRAVILAIDDTRAGAPGPAPEPMAR
jgi:hypothetical protein